jgi:hypothetical protein
MKTFTLFIFLILNFVLEVTGQNSDDILKEGKLLYRLEKASWYGTDFCLDTIPGIRDSIGGYLSYKNDDNKINTIFFSRTDSSRILVRLLFDSLPQEYPINTDTLNHVATQNELNLIQIRKDALRKVSYNEDFYFSFYKNTSFNFIPIITATDRKVYVITAPLNSGVVIIGNDYLLTYDNKNEFSKKKRIHNSILQFPYKGKDSLNKLEATYHSHILSKYITATDICTLLLYKDFVEWKMHYVMSKKYVSIFDIKNESLVIITKKAWDRIYKDQQTRHKDE